MEGSTSDFRFLGNRDYIQGPVLLAFTLEALWRSLSGEDEIDVQLFKINRQVDRNVAVVREGGEPAERAAEIRFKTRHGADGAALKLTGEPITARDQEPPAIVREIESDDAYSGSGLIQAAGFSDVLKGIVEINKQVHLAGHRTDPEHPRIRVVYFERFGAFRDITPEEIHVDIQNSSVRVYRDSCYSLSVASYELRGRRNQMKLCFSFNERAEA